MVTLRGTMRAGRSQGLTPSARSEGRPRNPLSAKRARYFAGESVAVGWPSRSCLPPHTIDMVGTSREKLPGCRCRDSSLSRHGRSELLGRQRESHRRSLVGAEARRCAGGANRMAAFYRVRGPAPGHQQPPSYAHPESAGAAKRARALTPLARWPSDFATGTVARSSRRFDEAPDLCDLERTMGSRPDQAANPKAGPRILSASQSRMLYQRY